MGKNKRNVCIVCSLFVILVQIFKNFRAEDAIDDVNANTNVVIFPVPTNTGSMIHMDDHDCNLIEDSCVEFLGKRTSRIWTQKPYSQWCSSVNQSQSTTMDDLTTPTGLILIKVPKSASSTSAAVTLRVQALHGCTTRWEHGRAGDIFTSIGHKNSMFYNTTIQPLFLYAPVRSPESRALSDVYFHQISFHRRHRNTNSTMKAPSDNFIIHHLRRTPSNYITDYLKMPHTSNISDISNTTIIVEQILEIINTYDFIMVANRMDESLVVFSWVAKLPISTIVTMSSKEAGSWYYSGKRCISLATSVQTVSIQNYFNTNEWKVRHLADRLLHTTVNESLNRTIEYMGDIFHTYMNQYKILKSQIQEKCHNETYFPCSTTGVPQLDISRKNCYVRDFGCGYPCIDQTIFGHG